jgi:hypothetical protein
MTKQKTFVALLALAMMAAGGSLASAQSVRFSIGGGHGFHHHHHCPPSYYFGYSPPPIYVYPRYVAPPPVTYVYPYAAAPAAVVPQPLATAPTPTDTWKPRTEPRANMLPVSEGQVAIIRNPVSSGGAVSFVVDEDREVALAEGQSHKVANHGGSIVEFDRGGDFGTARKTLGSGLYEFVATERGWDLVSSKDRIQTATRPSVKSNALPTLKR